MDMQTVRATARERMEGFCRVCPVCDGRACAGEVPGMGGLGTGSGFRANVQALARVRLNMRCLHEAVEPDMGLELFGRRLAFPVLAAPMGGVGFNMGAEVSEQDYASAVLAGCLDQGVLGCTGDGVVDEIHQSGFAALRALDGWGIPFVKPWEDEELYAKLEAARATGAPAVGMDVDAAGLITLRQQGRPVSPKGTAKLAEIISRAGLPFVVKGLMTADEARAAADAGAAGIVVSNHGGRVLDHVPGTAEVLHSVASAVQGRLTVLADGGVRDGADVLKMLALGADAVLIGRPVAIAAMGGLRQGVAGYLGAVRAQLAQAMVLTGCADLGSVSRRVLYAPA